MPGNYGQLPGALRRRLQRKLLTVAPIIAGAILLAGVLSVLTLAIEPMLPPTGRQLLDQLQQGDWTASRTRLLQLFDGYGDAKVYVFLGLQILQVLVAPIPAPVVGLLGGYLFGFWQGLFVSVLGLTIGSAIAMGVSRVLGESVVRKMVPPALLSRFDHLIDSGDVWSFFMIFLLPVLPDDAVCFIAGLTRLPLHRLLLVCVVGRLPGIAVLTFVGANLDGHAAHAYLVLGAGMLVAFMLWLFSEEIEGRFARSGSN